MTILDLTMSWAAVEIEEEGALDTEGASYPIVTSAYGPFATQAEAYVFADQFNAEYDGSPWHVIVRPMTIVKAAQ
jgi:hypothetical protein